jgi:hypothetical protein
MKKNIFIVFLFTLLSSIALWGQEDDGNYQTIFGHGNTRISGFGGPCMNFTRIGDDFAHMMGGGGGILINNFFLGGYGMGKTNELFYKNDITKENIMDFGHGGFWLGYTFLYKSAIHPVIHTQIGWGSISKRLKDNWNFDPTLDTETDQVFVLSPTAELEMNFSRFFKLGAGINYQFVYNTDGPYTFSDFAKPGVFVSFKFGWFN